MTKAANDLDRLRIRLGIPRITGTAKKARDTEFDGVVLLSQYRSCKKKINVDVNVICFLRKTKELRARYKMYVSGAHY